MKHKVKYIDWDKLFYLHNFNVRSYESDSDLENCTHTHIYMCVCVCEREIKGMGMLKDTDMPW